MNKLLTSLAIICVAITMSAAEPDVQPVDKTKIDREQLDAQRNKKSNLYNKVPLEGHYVGYAGIELASPSFFGDGGANYGVVTSHGYMVTDKIFAGAGVGYIEDFTNKQGVIPVFAEGRYFFQSQYQRRIYPHINARAGALFATEGGTGFMLQAGIGIRIPFSNSFAMNFEIGPHYSTKYRRQAGKMELTYNGPFKNSDYAFGFFARVNFEF